MPRVVESKFGKWLIGILTALLVAAASGVGSIAYAQWQQVTENKEEIAVIKSQYSEILRRLGNIEMKVDNLGSVK